jgi:hypothetical protein
MPNFEIASKIFTINRSAVIIDTNIMVNAFWRGSKKKDETIYFLDEWQHQWIIPIGVVVESWGFIVGKERDWEGGFNLLIWLNTPGKNLLIIGHNGEIIEEQTVIELHKVDCVDSMILTLAKKLTEDCGLEKPIPIATWDTRDFLRLVGQGDLRFRLYDLNEDLIQDFD